MQIERTCCIFYVMAIVMFAQSVAIREMFIVESDDEFLKTATHERTDEHTQRQTLVSVTICLLRFNNQNDYFTPLQPIISS